MFELRTYTTFDEKLDDLHARFNDHTMALFEKHGMHNVAYWIPTEKPNTLVYLIAHQNEDAIKSGWQAFGSDPAWQKVYADSIA
ncbi:MAG: NIPSNAP family protein, partial [Gammaproteobacteria bacterium]|nr:NIPSNAP family protein [Gammaproteobacteria bacterium]